MARIICRRQSASLDAALLNESQRSLSEGLTNARPQPNKESSIPIPTAEEFPAPSVSSLGVLFNPELVRHAVVTSDSQSEALLLLGLTPKSDSFSRLQAACVRFGLDVPGRRTKAALVISTRRVGKFGDAELVRRACDGATSMSQAVRALGVAPCGKNYERLILACEKFGVTPPPLRNNRGSALARPSSQQRALARLGKVSLDELSALALLPSLSAVLRVLKMDLIPSNLEYLRMRLQSDGLELPSSRQARTQVYSRTSDADYFALGTRHNSGHMKKRLIGTNLIPNELCSECGVPRLWNDKRLELQLDHINGESSDNRLENLRFLCPNCHSQTDTFCRPKARPVARVEQGGSATWMVAARQSGIRVGTALDAQGVRTLTAMRSAGKSVREICLALSVSETTVRRMLAETPTPE